jgi:hypothetical protein
VLDEKMVSEAPPPELNKIFHPTPPRLDPEVRRKVKTPDLTTPAGLGNMTGNMPMLSLVLVAVLAGVVFALGAILPKHLVLRPELQVRRFLKAARQKDWATMYDLSAGAEKAFPTEAAYAAAMQQLTASDPGASVYGNILAGRSYKVGRARIIGNSATVPLTVAGVASAPGIEVMLEKKDSIWKLSDAGDFGKLAAGQLPAGMTMRSAARPAANRYMGGFGRATGPSGFNSQPAGAPAAGMMTDPGMAAQPSASGEMNTQPQAGDASQSPQSAPEQQDPQGQPPAEGGEGQGPPPGQQPPQETGSPQSPPNPANGGG